MLESSIQLQYRKKKISIPNSQFCVTLWIFKVWRCSLFNWWKLRSIDNFCPSSIINHTPHFAGIGIGNNKRNFDSMWLENCWPWFKLESWMIWNLYGTLCIIIYITLMIHLNHLSDAWCCRLYEAIFHNKGPCCIFNNKQISGSYLFHFCTLLETHPLCA